MGPSSALPLADLVENLVRELVQQLAQSHADGADGAAPPVELVVAQQQPRLRDAGGESKRSTGRSGRYDQLPEEDVTHERDLSPSKAKSTFSKGFVLLYFPFATGPAFPSCSTVFI